MTKVLIISTGESITAVGERVQITLPPPVVPNSVTGIKRALRVSARRRAVARAERAINDAVARVSPDAVIIDNWLALEFGHSLGDAKVLAVAILAYAKDGTVKDSWRIKKFLTDIETTIVFHERDRFALIELEIYNARVIDDDAGAWREEVQQALR